MRIYLRSCSHVSRVSKTLAYHFPQGLKLSLGQEWVSKMLGYRDFHELQQLHATELPSDLDEACPAVVREERRVYQAKALATSSGLSLSAARAIVEAVRPSGSLVRGSAASEASTEADKHGSSDAVAVAVEADAVAVGGGAVNGSETPNRLALKHVPHDTFTQLMKRSSAWPDQYRVYDVGRACKRMSQRSYQAFEACEGAYPYPYLGKAHTLFLASAGENGSPDFHVDSFLAVYSLKTDFRVERTS